MKTSDLIKILQELPEDSQLCALWWTKDTFEDFDEPISPLLWTQVCDEFDAWDNADGEISQWIHSAIIDNKNDSEEEN